MKIQSAEYLTSVVSVEKLPVENIPEIAIAGKSNVGKSTFINFLCNRKKLAKTSKEPGRTRMLNYFTINGGKFMIVDLPGYGFARVSAEEKQKWGALLENYFQHSKNIKNVFLLLDIRHDPSTDDRLMLNYLYYYRIPFTILATKADKLSRSAGMKRKKELADAVGVGVDNIYICSSLNKTGLTEITERMEEILSVASEETQDAEMEELLSVASEETPDAETEQDAM